MDIKKVQELKENLEAAIRDKLNDFAFITDLNVTNVGIVIMDASTVERKSTIISSVKIKVEL